MVYCFVAYSKKLHFYYYVLVMVENVSFFHWNFMFRVSMIQKRGKMSIEEISKKFAKNRHQLQKIDNISICFTNFSPIFKKNQCLHLLLIYRLLAFPRWSNSPDLVRSPTVNFMCISNGPNWSWMLSNG